MSHPGFVLPLTYARSVYTALTLRPCRFWPVTVVFDCNNQDMTTEDRYAGTEESDEGYLPDERDNYLSRSARGRTYSSSAYRGGGYGTSHTSSRAGSTSRRRRDSAGFYHSGSQYDGNDGGYLSDYRSAGSARGRSYTSGSRRRSMSAMSSSSSGSGSDSDDNPSLRSGRRSRSGSMSAQDINQLTSGMGRLSHSGSFSSLRRSASRSSFGY